MEDPLKKAGFWKRFAAHMLDVLIIFFFYNSLFWFIYNQISIYSDVGGHKELFMFACFIFSPLSVLISWSYFSGFESSPLMATPGKLAVGIYVTDMNGDRVSFGRATGRFFGKLISAFILTIGYILAGITEKKQALHDIIAGCLVLSK